MSVPERELGLKRVVDTDERGSLTLLIPSNDPAFVQEHALASQRLDEALKYYEFTAYQKSIELTNFLRSAGLGPDFQPAEVAFSPFSEGPFLDIGVAVNITYRVTEKDGVKQIKPTPVLTTPLLLGEQVEKWREEGLEVEPLKPFVDLGRGGVMVNFPARFGPKAPGGPESSGLISMIMERKNDPQDPLLIVGPRVDLEKGIQSVNRVFEPIKVGRAQFNEIISGLEKADKLYGGYRRRPTSKMISEESNVEKVEVFSQNGAFFNNVLFDLKNGRRVGYNLNRSFWIEADGKKVLNEGAMFSVLHQDSKGEPLMLVVTQRRAHRATGQVETSRGFAASDALKKARFLELNEETGLNPDEVVKHVIATVECIQDPIREDVKSRLEIIKLPPEMRVDLDKLAEKVRAKDRPAGPIEDLTPHWMKLRDMVEGIVKGTYVRDAHTAYTVLRTLSHLKAIDISPWLNDLSVVVELVQDFSTGGPRITIPRGDSRLAESQLDGVFNGNSGAYRIENYVGYSTKASVLPGGSYQIVGMKELWDAACDGRLDIVASTALMKCIFQKGYARVNYEKIYSD